jgi:hypothetical protein
MQFPGYLWQGRPLPALWTVGAVSSIVLNVILISVLVLVGRQLFAIKQLVQRDVLGGLYYNFLLMDQADIETTILVEERVPVQFDLPVQTNTRVILTQDTTIRGARVTLNTGGLNIVNAPTDIVLPANTVLPIALDIIVPVNTTIPITLNVPVSIPLNETELHTPFVGLQDVIAPFYLYMRQLPDSWSGVAFCLLPWTCR